MITMAPIHRCHLQVEVAVIRMIGMFLLLLLLFDPADWKLRFIQAQFKLELQTEREASLARVLFRVRLSATAHAQPIV